MKTTLDEWIRTGTYLPKPLRDFHDQKDVFKRVDEIIFQRQQAEPKAYLLKHLPGWTHAHVYVVDFFLWYMARCGWTLQRSRMPLEFVDLDVDIAAHRERYLQQMQEAERT